LLTWKRKDKKTECSAFLRVKTDPSKINAIIVLINAVVGRDKMITASAIVAE
jgi:hypothetical protein